jgi:hypothetical protein
MSCTCNTPNARPPCSWCTRPLCVRCGSDAAKDCEHWPEPICEHCLDLEIDKVPDGHYCYQLLGVVSMGSATHQVQTRVCPFWSKNPDVPPHEAGICSLIGMRDWESENLTLLWDQVKECGLKMP